MTPEEKKAEKERKAAERRQILADWKAEKKKAAELKRLRMKARPFWLKLLCFLRNAALVIAVCAGVFFLLDGPNRVIKLVAKYYSDDLTRAGYDDADPEEVRALIPADTDAQASIAAMDGFSRDDTWTVCIYMIGSNLESGGENDLSPVVSVTTGTQLTENQSADRQAVLGRIQEFADSIAAEGMDMPGPLYYPNPPESASVTAVTTQVVKTDETGAATMDLDEIRKAKLPDNISVVIQTGGSPRWSDPRVNPNRVQRFCYSSRGFEEEDSVPTHNMATADSVADFMRWCDEKHPADHKIIIFWDHGAGAFGYGNDDIFGGSLTLADLKTAFASVYTPDPENPPFEVIGFDACLMACQEAVSAFDGFGRYFAGSEEVEPGFGWYYTDWLTQLAENPGMNGAQVGLAIADSYMDFYARQNINMSIFPGSSSLTFSVLDIHKCAEVNSVYDVFCRKILEKTGGDPKVISDISSAARSSIHYGGTYNKCFNLVDLGLFMDAMPSEYESLTAPVKAALAGAVLYTRSDKILAGSQGLSVYFPDHIAGASGVQYLMDYVDNVSSDTTGALYFYKAAGCLTGEMRTSLSEKGIPVPANLNTAVLAAVSASPVSLGEGGSFSLQVPEEARVLMQNPQLVIGRIDEENNKTIYYGTDSLVTLDESGKLSADFDGRWLMLDKQLLSVEIINESPDSILYSSPVLIDGKDSTLLFRYDRAEKAYSILGAYADDDDGVVADYAGRSVSDLAPGVMITPVYSTTSFDSYVPGQTTGKAVRYDRNTAIRRSALPDGNYIEMASFTSTRGDEFSAGIVELTVKKGKVDKAEVSTKYVAVGHN